MSGEANTIWSIHMMVETEWKTGTVESCGDFKGTSVYQVFICLIFLQKYDLF